MLLVRLIRDNETFRDIAISLLATYGLYFFGSFIHLEPYHMFTSFIQYMFLLPSCKSLPSPSRPPLVEPSCCRREHLDDVRYVQLARCYVGYQRRQWCC